MKLPVPVVALLAEATARPLAASWRWRTPAEGVGSELRNVAPPLPLEPAIYALWHEHLLPLAFAHRGEGVTALVSGHRDGEILTRVLGRLGHRAARGSSTRGGEEGLEEMLAAAEEGHALAFTPDGPRGPARRCKPGVVLAAAATGLPVVPLAAAASAGRRLGSWDRFLLPGPFARVVVSRGDPLEVPGDLSEAWRRERDACRKRVRRWTGRIREALEAERRRCESALGSAVT